MIMIMSKPYLSRESPVRLKVSYLNPNWDSCSLPNSFLRQWKKVSSCISAYDSVDPNNSLPLSWEFPYGKNFENFSFFHSVAKRHPNSFSKNPTTLSPSQNYFFLVPRLSTRDEIFVDSILSTIHLRKKPLLIMHVRFIRRKIRWLHVIRTFIWKNKNKIAFISKIKIPTKRLIIFDIGYLILENKIYK